MIYFGYCVFWHPLKFCAQGKCLTCLTLVLALCSISEVWWRGHGCLFYYYELWLTHVINVLQSLDSIE